MKPIKLGKQQVRQNGGAMVVKLPMKWLIAHSLQIGQPLYSVVTIDDVIRVHLEPVEWSKRAKIRKVSARGAAYLNISAPHARELGIREGSTVAISADEDHGVLMIKKVA